MSGTVEAIWIKRAKRGLMDPVREVTLVAGKGIEGDANFGRSRRQVTIIEKEVFDRIRENLPAAKPSMRRANVMVSGVRLEHTRGRVLRLGDVALELMGETRPCHRMDEQCQGLTDALDPGWNGGAFAVVLEGGTLRLGEAASIEAEIAAGG